MSPFRSIDNKLFIQWRAALECGFSKGTLDNARNRQSPSWEFIDDPADKRKVLIGYEMLKDDYKKKVVETLSLCDTVCSVSTLC